MNDTILCFGFRLRQSEIVKKADVFDKELNNLPGFLGLTTDDSDVIAYFNSEDNRDNAFCIVDKLFDWITVEPKPVVASEALLSPEVQKQEALNNAKILADCFGLDSDEVYYNEDGTMHTPPNFDEIVDSWIDKFIESEE